MSSQQASGFPPFPSAGCCLERRLPFRVKGTLQTECIGSAPFMAPEVVNQNYVRQQRIFARGLRSV